VPTSATTAPDVSFLELFRQCGGDFYRLDPLLFSPAVIEFANYRTIDPEHASETGGENKDILSWGQADWGRLVKTWAIHG
jgi:methenyltetrahydromethanopterin cyclohydrolase